MKQRHANAAEALRTTGQVSLRTASGVLWFGVALLGAVALAGIWMLTQISGTADFGRSFHWRSELPAGPVLLVGVPLLCFLAWLLARRLRHRDEPVVLDRWGVRFEAHPTIPWTAIAAVRTAAGAGGPVLELTADGAARWSETQGTLDRALLRMSTGRTRMPAVQGMSAAQLASLVEAAQRQHG